MPSFLDLPPELRNWVYSNVFANPEDRVTVVNESHEHWLAVARTGGMPSLSSPRTAKSAPKRTGTRTGALCMLGRLCLGVCVGRRRIRGTLDREA
ncbi:hypothetical protein LTS01_010318 [Friedmanniomyces endolithicus]|nr:hypothetical protein LTS01_010318 [Friedmanniomyces endolithicus]